MNKKRFEHIIMKKVLDDKLGLEVLHWEDEGWELTAAVTDEYRRHTLFFKRPYKK